MRISSLIYPVIEICFPLENLVVSSSRQNSPIILAFVSAKNKEKEKENEKQCPLLLLLLFPLQLLKKKKIHKLLSSILSLTTTHLQTKFTLNFNFKYCTVLHFCALWNKAIRVSRLGFRGWDLGIRVW